MNIKSTKIISIENFGDIRVAIDDTNHLYFKAADALALLKFKNFAAGRKYLANTTFASIPTPRGARKMLLIDLCQLFMLISKAPENFDAETFLTELLSEGIADAYNG